MTASATMAPRRGRPPKLTHAQVLDAGRDLATSEGYDAVTVRRLAAQLGVSTFAVHSHMGSKDELLDEIVMTLADSRPHRIREAKSWREGLVAYGILMWDLMLEHPTVLDVLQRSTRAPESVMDMLDCIVLLAEQDGVRAEELAAVYDTVWTFVLGYAGIVHARAQVDEQFERRARAESLQERLPNVARLARALATTERTAVFHERLAALVNALGPQR